MTTPPQPGSQEAARLGLFAGIIAYTIWGVFPVYFKATESVSAMELVAHRILWSVPFGLIIILFRRQLAETLKALKSWRMIGILLIAAIALALNWGIYIWAIQQGQIFQGSLGYYINPLIYVLVGVVLLGERLRRFQIAAVLLAFIGVAVLTVYGGVFPYISLSLAITFTIYGVIRKQVDIGAMPGLFIETLLLLLPACAYLFWITQNGTISFGNVDTRMTVLIMLAGPVTVLPLLAFAFAARRLKLSTLGILQYIGPTLQFACGVYYGEAFTTAHAICFGFIWVGVALFSYDAWRNRVKVV